MNSPTEKKSQADGIVPMQGDRLVYVMHEPGLAGSANDEINLLDLWHVLWQRKWIILAVTAIIGLGSVAYALAQTHWYRSEVLLAPADERSTPSLGGQIGGLVALAGVSVGGGSSAEALAVLNSREFARALIEEHDLLPVLFSQHWDAERGEWLLDDRDEWPDFRDGVRYFHKHILKVQEDRTTGLVTVAVEWTDPVLAAEWAASIVRRLNDRMRERALREAETNVAYLQAELAKTSVVTLQQSIGRLLETELQKLMLARGNEEFAFKVVDPAEVPKSPSRPRRALIAVLGTILGGILAVSGVLISNALRKSSLSGSTSRSDSNVQDS